MMKRQPTNDNKRPRSQSDERFRILWMALLLMTLVAIATVVAG
jgi:hypothetical protein